MADYEYDLARLSSSSVHTLLDARHLIEVRETPGKGLGIFAKENISRGTRIVAERPLLKVNILSSHCVDVQTPFNNLPLPAQKAYLGLHGYASNTLKKDNDWNSLSALTRKILAIYAANHWGRDVFWLASRFNHSCIPNLHNAYNPNIKMETFHSIRDIKAGDELTVSYVSGICARQERQEQLNKWGFQCRCPACENTSSGIQLESKLARLAVLNQRVNMLIPDEQKLDMYQTMAALMHSIGLVGKSLHQCYLDAAFYSAVSGNVRMAVLWTEKEVEINYRCIGQDRPDYQKELTVLHQLKQAANSAKAFHYMQIDWIMDWDQGPS